MDIDDVVSTAKKEITTLINREFTEAKAAAKAEAAAFLEESKANLDKWGKQLAAEKIDAEEYEDLVRMQLNLGRILALKQAGLTADRAKKLAGSVLEIVIRIGIKAALA
jgi:hypothetical protein